MTPACWTPLRGTLDEFISCGFAAVLVFLMGLGILMSRRVKNSSDFLVAGRSLGPGRLFATFLAANIGAGSTVGATGLGYRFGMSAWWWVGSASIGTFLLSQFLGPKLWTIAKQHGLSTLQDFLEFRYGKAVKAVISVLFWFGALAILAGQLIAISWILNTVAGIPKWEGCVIGGIVAIVYCTAGGMMSSSFVNMFELAVTMSGLLLAVPFALHTLGGWSHVHELVLHRRAERRLDVQHDWCGGKADVCVDCDSGSFVHDLAGAGAEGLRCAGCEDGAARRGLNSLGQAMFAFVPAVLGCVRLQRCLILRIRNWRCPPR